MAKKRLFTSINMFNEDSRANLHWSFNDFGRRKESELVLPNDNEIREAKKEILAGTIIFQFIFRCRDK